VTTRGELLSIQVGTPKDRWVPEHRRVDFREGTWTSAIFKSVVMGAVRVTGAGIEGDAQADLVHHGGPDNVVLAYDADHYPHWRDRLNMPDLPFGGFGENFTVRGFSDETVCIADVWQVGDGPDSLLLQVTQARQPCFKLARRLEQPHIVKMVHETSWGGWYLRVLREGMAENGMSIFLRDRKYPGWTVARAVQTMYARKNNLTEAQELAALPELSRRWKHELLREFD
jgi:MOSC domain-containing protein YiiM